MQRLLPDPKKLFRPQSDHGVALGGARCRDQAAEDGQEGGQHDQDQRSRRRQGSRDAVVAGNVVGSTMLAP